MLKGTGAFDKKGPKGFPVFLEYNEADIHDFFLDTWDKTRPGLKYHYLTSEECFRCLTCSLKDEDEKVAKALFNAYDRLNKTMNEKSFRNKYELEFPIDYEE